MPNDSLKSIRELMGCSFNIPSYQRGYRWGKDEVTALLEDIWDYAERSIETANDNVESKSFYCLQPIVIKKDGDKYNVIDGQQRLTTIFLILKYLTNQNYFEISYQTRGEKSKNFLENIDKNFKIDSIKNENMDFYHFSNAYENIDKFFGDEKIDKEKFKTTLLESCKVLWYEIQDKENDVFIRLNIGKIPLLPAENIKALFLAKNEELDYDDLKDRAESWYNTEKKARENNDFIYCVLSKVDSKHIDSNNFTLSDNIQRIEPYLQAICQAKDKESLFNYFYDKYKNNEINKEWEKLESSIDTLQSFASGQNEKIYREIFHYLGFLILSGEKIYDLYDLWLEDSDNDIFKNKLFNKVKNKISNDIANIDELTYNEKNHRVKLHNILLLFNLEYLITREDSNVFFQFNKFQLQEWSLEHIYAQKSKSIKESIKYKDNEKITKWLRETLEYIEEYELKKRISKIIKNLDSNNKDLDDILDNIDKEWKENENLHKLQNLSLLDKQQNSKIGNLIFSEKRKAIQELRRDKKLIPETTGMVFNKEFSSQLPDEDFFRQTDQEDYLNAIKKLLKKYEVKNG